MIHLALRLFYIQLFTLLLFIVIAIQLLKIQVFFLIHFSQNHLKTILLFIYFSPLFWLDDPNIEFVPATFLRYFFTKQTGTDGCQDEK